MRVLASVPALRTFFCMLPGKLPVFRAVRLFYRLKLDTDGDGIAGGERLFQRLVKQLVHMRR